MDGGYLCRRQSLRSHMHTVQLGLRANLPQFTLLVVINAFVGGMVGMERSILPQLAEVEFGIAAKTAIFILPLPLFQHSNAPALKP